MMHNIIIYIMSKHPVVVASMRRASRPSETVGEVVKEGQEVFVKLLGFDDRGKVRLSMKIVDQATGKEIPRAEGEAPEEAMESRPPRRDRGGDRGGRGGERRRGGERG
jgi:polyribonucleotide nucleotidyltransferase